jgi:hypothetical protein
VLADRSNFKAIIKDGAFVTCALEPERVAEPA